MSRTRALSLLLAGVLAVAGCGGDDDVSPTDGPGDDGEIILSDAERPYAETLGAELGVEGIDDAEAICVGGAFVRAVGVDRFHAVGIDPADVDEGFDRLWSPEDVDVASLLEDIEGCGVMAELAASFAPPLALEEMTSEAFACVAGQLGAAEARSIVELYMGGGDFFGSETSGQVGIVTDALRSCEVRTLSGG